MKNAVIHYGYYQIVSKMASIFYFTDLICLVYEKTVFFGYLFKQIKILVWLWK